MEIFQHPTRASGIRYGNAETEWILASIWANHTYIDFRDQPVEYQEKIIAAYRVRQQIDAVLSSYANRQRR